MKAVRGWSIAFLLVWAPRAAYAQVDAGRDATDGATPSVADSGGTSGCNLHTSFGGDEQCILPPAAGFQLHYGPANYDDPGAVAPYLVPPGAEVEQCLFMKTPNTGELFANEFHFRARPGLFGASLWRLSAARPDSVVPEPCGALTGAVPLLSLQGATADLTPDGAPENAGLAWDLAPATQVAMKIHSIDVTDHELLSEAWLNVVPADAATVTARLEGLELRAIGEDVPAGSQITHSFACAAPGELRIVDITGVESASVQELKVQVRRADGSTETIYDSYDWHEPIALRYDSVTLNPAPDAASLRSGGVSGVLLLHPGDSLEWACTVANTTAQVLPYGSGLVYNGVVCDVRGAVVRSDGTGWTCVDDRARPEAGVGSAGASGSGGSAPAPDSGSGAGGRGGTTGRAGAPAPGGNQTASGPDGGSDTSAAGVRDTGGCNCRTSSGTPEERRPIGAAMLALLGISARRVGKSRARSAAGRRVGTTRRNTESPASSPRVWRGLTEPRRTR